MNTKHLGQTLLSVALIVGLGMGCSIQSKAALYEVRYNDGKTRFQVEEVDGAPHGRAVSYHPNGTKSSEGFYRRGQPHGHFVYWDVNGTFVEQRIYNRGAVKWSSDDPTVKPPNDYDLTHETNRQPNLLVEAFAGAGGDAPLTLDNAASPGSGVFVGGMVLTRVLKMGLAGATLSYATTDDDQSQLFAGLTVGHRFDLGWPVRPEVLIEVGAHQIRHLEGRALASDDQFGNVFMPYAGLRLGAALDITSNVALSLSVTGRRDVHTRVRVVYDCMEGSDCPRSTWNLGGNFVTGQLALRLIFD